MPSIALPYPFPPTPSIIQQLSVHTVISSTCTDVGYFDIVNALSFSFFLFEKNNTQVKNSD
jgi:hypothetical protein